MKGKIYLIPTTLGDADPNNVLPPVIKSVIETVDHFIVENIRSARRYIRQLSKTKDIDKIRFYELNKHTEKSEISSYLAVIEEGKDIGLISEAGNPGIADPGADIAAIAHQKNYRVIPLVGPSSVLLALISSGLNGQNFAFNGYLPIKQNKRTETLKLLEKRSRTEGQSQIFMETPYRNDQMFDSIMKTCQPDTYLCIAADITLANEYIKTKPVSEWKRSKPDLNKRPTIFILHAYDHDRHKGKK